MVGFVAWDCPIYLVSSSSILLVVTRGLVIFISSVLILCIKLDHVYHNLFGLFGWHFFCGVWGWEYGRDWDWGHRMEVIEIGGIDRVPSIWCGWNIVPNRRGMGSARSHHLYLVLVRISKRVLLWERNGHTWVMAPLIRGSTKSIVWCSIQVSLRRKRAWLLVHGSNESNNKMQDGGCGYGGWCGS